MNILRVVKVALEICYAAAREIRVQAEEEVLKGLRIQGAKPHSTLHTYT